jgi:hypothetical protein
LTAWKKPRWSTDEYCTPSRRDGTPKAQSQLRNISGGNPFDGLDAEDPGTRAAIARFLGIGKAIEILT